MAEHGGYEVQTEGMPAEAHGFSIEFRHGPYPPDQPRSHRRAVYAILTPVSPKVKRAMDWIGRKSIRGEAPLDAASATFVDLPESVQERICLEALKPAAALAKRVAAGAT